MNRLLVTYHAVTARLDEAAPAVVPTLARVVFALVLFAYYWNSAKTKVGDSFLSPSLGAYAQIFPRTMEQVGFDVSRMNGLHTLVVLGGTWAEFLLPVLIVAGLFTRIAALGMIGFVAMQSLVDIVGHGLAAKDIGAWFDNDASALILDQRAFWVFLLIVLIMKGAGPFSADHLLARFR